MKRYIIIWHTSWQNNDYGADFEEDVNMYESQDDWLDACRECTSNFIILDTKEWKVYCSSSPEVIKTREDFDWYMDD
jgi:hypothetical protein